MSRIEAAYEESDQRRYWVPCPISAKIRIDFIDSPG
jgi:phage terminase large subunit GpA-like protein